MKGDIISIRKESLNLTEKNIQFNCEIFSKEDLDKVGIAFCIKDSAMQAALKYNSIHSEDSKYFNIKKNKDKALELVFLNILADGNYFIDIALFDVDGNELLSHNNLIKFRVSGRGKSVQNILTLESIKLK